MSGAVLRGPLTKGIITLAKRKSPTTIPPRAKRGQSACKAHGPLRPNSRLSPSIEGAGSCTASPLRSRVSTPSSEVPPHSRLSIPSSEFLPRSRGSAPPRVNIKLFHARGRPSTDDVAHPLRSTRALNALICCGMPKSKANRLPHHATGIAWDSARLSLGTVRPNPITVWLTPVVVQVLCGPIRTGRRHFTALCF
jgi:hypothetical protein